MVSVNDSEMERFWRKQMAQFSQATALHPAAQGLKRLQRIPGEMDGELLDVSLPPKLIATLDELAAADGFGLVDILLGAWALLLSHYSGQAWVVFGWRSLASDSLPFMMEVPVEAEIANWLQKVSAKRSAIRDHAAVKLVDIHRWLELPANRPLFGSEIVYQDQNEDIWGVVQDQPVFRLCVTNADTGLSLRVECDQDLFDHRVVAHILDHFTALLGEIGEKSVSKGAVRLCDLLLLTQAEKEVYLREWAEPLPNFSNQLCLQQLFENQAAQRPQAIALVYQTQRLTYHELNRRANRLAHHLHSLGVGVGEPVALYLERSVEMVVAILAILKAGGVYLPIDPAYPLWRVKFILQDSAAQLLLTQKSLAEQLPAEGPRILFLDDDLPTDVPTDPANLPKMVTPDQAAYIIYTSGSTGEPKGVLVGHNNVARLFLSTEEWFHFGQEDTWTMFHSYAFDFSVWEMWGALLYGGRLVVVPHWVSRSPEAYAALLQEERVTVLNQTPSAFSALLQVDAMLDPSHSPHLRLVIFGGEALNIQSLRPWFECRGDRSPQLVNMYGITETTVHVTYRSLTMKDLANQGSPIGLPLPDLRVILLDRFLHPAPPGLPAEICVAGAGLSLGYLYRPELDAEKFVTLDLPPPFDRVSVPGRIYRSGDLARYRIQDGHLEELEFLGRIDQQVKIRGYRIELGEIESVLSAHPAVEQVAVTLWQPNGGEGRLVAYLVLGSAASTRPSTQELRAFCKLRLPAYMLPSAFVTLDALPLTPNGKLDRRALPSPGATRPNLIVAFTPPRTPTEEKLQQIWQVVLGSDDIGVHDDFFDLGGHSLASARVLSQVFAQFQVEMPLSIVFETPTIAGLAAYIDRAQADARRLTFPPLEKAARDKPIPLSYSQEQIWVLKELAPKNLAYNSQETIRFRGKLDISALEQALTAIVARHEIFYTTFEQIDDQLQQVIHKPWQVKLPLADLSQIPPEQVEAKIEAIVNQSFQQVFDTTRLPLIRWKLLKISTDEHILIHVEHHFVHDGWSFALLMQDLKALYAAYTAGKSSPLPELVFQFVDFTAWQRKLYEGGYLEPQLAYWQARLAGAPAILQLPADHPRPKQKSYRGAATRFNLPDRLFEELKSFSRCEGVTLFVTLLSAFKVLLYRYSQQEDLVVGTGFANRRLPEIEKIVGMVINTAALRSDLSGDPTFRQLLERVRSVLLGAYDNQEAPFEKVVERLQPERIPGVNPLFQVIFSFHDSPVPELRFPELNTHIDYRQNDSAKFDMNVVVIPRSEQLVGQHQTKVSDEVVVIWEYDTDLFEKATIERMATNYQKLLESILVAPLTRLSELPLLSAIERRQVLFDWNETYTDYPREIGIQTLFETQVARQPDALALQFDDRRINYRELNWRANQLAHFLQANGVRPGTPVAICADRSPEMVMGMIAAIKAGGAYVPLDPGYPAERLAFMLADCQAPVLLTLNRFHTRLPESEALVICLDEDWEIINRFDRENPPESAAPDGLAYIIYTSGSTGAPKGIQIPQRGITSLVLNTDYVHLQPGDRLAHASNVSFDAATFEVWGALLNGGTLIGIPGEVLLSPPDLAAYLRHEAIDVMFLTTALFNQVAANQPDAFASLRTLLFGGEAVSPGWVRAVLEFTPPKRLVHVYGPTENTTFTTWYLVEDVPPGAVTVPIGHPIANAKVYVLDERQQPAPLGAPGELYIGGDGLAICYHNAPELTAEKFIPSPFDDRTDRRLYRSGDWVRQNASGAIEFLGRQDSQVKMRGFRIELEEIEIILSDHPRVQTAAVILREDPQGDKRLFAYLVLQPGSDLKFESMRAYLSNLLPDYMVPASFVVLDELPLTPNGKINRHALINLETGQPLLDIAAIPPRTALEGALASLWTETLGLEQVGIHDNFFSLGGHSLLAIRLIFQINDLLDETAPLSMLFEAPSVAAFAAVLSAHSGDPGRLEKTASLLLKLAHLSDAEARRLLVDKPPDLQNFSGENNIDE